MTSKWLVLVGVGLAVATLAARVSSFDRVRRTVEISVAGGTEPWRLRLPTIGSSESPWRVVTLDVVNGSEPVVMRATAATAATTVALAPGESRRLTLVTESLVEDSQLEVVTTPRTGSWSAIGATISNARGFTNTIVGLTIVPARQPLQSPPLWLWALTVGAGYASWLVAAWPGLGDP